jgi:hypothetical protein
LSARIEGHGEHMCGQEREGFVNGIGAVGGQIGVVDTVDENVRLDLF